MTPSPRAKAFVKGFEKCRLSAYMPTPKDRPTVGWGSTGPDIRMGMTWTQEQADARFDRDADGFAAAVTKHLGGRPTTQSQFDAMWSLAYNIGETNFAASTLLKLHKAGEFSAAAQQFQRWNKQAGVVLNGLTKRRLAEAAIYSEKAA